MKLKWVILAILIMILSIVYYKCDYEYLEDFRKIEKEFKKIDGVELLELKIGNPDLTAEEIHAKIRINNDAIIHYGSSIFSSDFYTESSFNIRQYGEWKFQTYICTGRESDQYDWWEGNIYLGKEGLFNKLSSLYLSNIKESIINYKELEKIVMKIPEYPKIGVINSNSIYSMFVFRHNQKVKPYTINFTDNTCDSLRKIAIKL